MSRAVAHLMAQDVTVEGKHRRQRCTWCGVAIIDEDLTRVQVPEGQEGGLPVWPPGAWVEVEGKWPTVYRIVEESEPGKMPHNACMRDVAPLLRAVPDEERGEGAG